MPIIPWNTNLISWEGMQNIHEGVATLMALGFIYLAVSKLDVQSSGIAEKKKKIRGIVSDLILAVLSFLLGLYFFGLVVAFILLYVIVDLFRSTVLSRLRDHGTRNRQGG